ncbi:carboxymethylenebutenolidase [Ranunculus cassubicifolius]
MSGPQCCENPKTLSSSLGVRIVEEIATPEAYICSFPDLNQGAVVDDFGYEARNLRYNKFILLLHDRTTCLTLDNMEFFLAQHSCALLVYICSMRGSVGVRRI